LQAVPRNELRVIQVAGLSKRNNRAMVRPPHPFFTSEVALLQSLN
jgi:hypothetical protein